MKSLQKQKHAIRLNQKCFEKITLSMKKNEIVIWHVSISIEQPCGYRSQTLTQG
jgi:hypothetical protein